MPYQWNWEASNPTGNRFQIVEKGSLIPVCIVEDQSKIDLIVTSLNVAEQVYGMLDILNIPYTVMR